MLTPKRNLRTGQPYWLSHPFPRIPKSALRSDQKTDVVIIGAGITGAMAAEELTASGFKVILLDRRGPLKGSTSATTALLQYEIDTPLVKLRQQIGADDALRAWRRSKLGLDSLAAKIQSLDIACRARRSSSLYLSGDVLDAEALKEECELRNRIGLHTDYLTRRPLLEAYGIRRSAALLSFDNLAVDPLRLAAGFLLRAVERGAEIYAPVVAEEVEVDSDRVRVHTQEGPTVTAGSLIYATGYEIPKSARRRRLSVYSTYAIATRSQPDRLWPGEVLIWEASDPYLYVRTTRDGRVICGGEDEEFEDEEKRDALIGAKTATLERKLGALFPRLHNKAEFAWSGSFGASTTGLPLGSGARHVLVYHDLFRLHSLLRAHRLLLERAWDLDHVRRRGDHLQRGQPLVRLREHL